MNNIRITLWRRGVVVTTYAQLHSVKLDLRFCAGLNPAPGVSEIRDREDLGPECWLERTINAFCRSTIRKKQFIIIIVLSEAFKQYWQRSVKPPFFDIALTKMRPHFSPKKGSHYQCYRLIPEVVNELHKNTTNKLNQVFDREMRSCYASASILP